MLVNRAHQAVPSVPTARPKMDKDFAMCYEGRALTATVATWCISRILTQLVHSGSVA